MDLDILDSLIHSQEFGNPRSSKQRAQLLMMEEFLVLLELFLIGMMMVTIQKLNFLMERFILVAHQMEQVQIVAVKQPLILEINKLQDSKIYK